MGASQTSSTTTRERVSHASRLCDRMDKARGTYTPALDVIAERPVTEWVWRPGFGWVEREVQS